MVIRNISFVKSSILLIDSKIAIFESTVICDYLNSENNDLYPINRVEAAVNKSWISYSSEILDVIARSVVDSLTDTY